MGYYLITILWVALDQWTKKWTVTNMTIGQTIPLIENVFHLTYSNNYGAAFSILQNKQTFLILFTLSCSVPWKLVTSANTSM